MLNLRPSFLLCLATLVLSLPCGLRAGGKPSLVVAFLVEGDEFEGPRMVQPLPIQGTAKFFRKVPMLTQKNIKAFYPFPAADGSYGICLRVDEMGWRAVREAGSLEAGKLLAAVVNGRLVQTMAIDNPKKDDHIVVIWKNITEAEIAVFRKNYPEIANPTAQEKDKADAKEKARAKKELGVTDLTQP